jgi:hypothetical protein
MGSFLTTALQVVLSYGVMFLLLWAFYDATRFTKAQFKATKRMGRTPWLITLGFAIALNLWLGGFRFAEPLGGRSLSWIATVVLLVVYGYDTRPRLLRQRTAGA